MNMEPNKILHLAVVGHTNTGKTSLLRTLTHDTGFGEVADFPGTTRHVEGARLFLNGQAAVELFDTPGLEDGIALLDYLDQLKAQTRQDSSRFDGPESIQRFLDTPESRQRFEQEARVLRKLLECDAGLYVIDIRDPVLAKHRDELAILSRCGRPLVPILNFMHSSPNYLPEWKESLGRLGLHLSIEFDTVAPALDGEEQLYQKLALVLDSHAAILKALSEDIHRQRKLRRDIAYNMIAELLIDVTAFRYTCAGDEESIKSATALLQDVIRQREQESIQALLTHYRFRQEDYPDQTLPIEGGRWGMDLFQPQALMEMGIQVSKGFVAGAMAGAAVDVMSAGLSLGTATLIGGVIGSVWQGVDKFGKRILGKLQGYREITLDDAIIRLLGIRSLQLLNALEMRGHADQRPIMLNTETVTGQFKDGDLPEEILEARTLPQWSKMSEHFETGARRNAAIKSLARKLR